MAQPFSLDTSPVTHGHWEAVMEANPHEFIGAPTRPVEQVSWNDVQEFIQKLNAQERGTPYRLPTEAAWEYAARAGTEGTRYHTDVDAIAWYDEHWPITFSTQRTALSAKLNGSASFTRVFCTTPRSGALRE